MTERSETSKNPIRRRPTLFAGAIATGLLAGLAGIYGIAALQRNPEAPSTCRADTVLAGRLAQLARGEVAALAPAQAPIRVSGLSFLDANGRERTLSEWHGRTVLLNLWATWCIPCRKEMPALDALQAKLGGPSFEVVAVNIDTRDTEKPKAWLKEVNAGNLAYYADPKARIFQDLKIVGRAFGMPTTLLIDKNGCEIATLAGPAEWASADAVAYIEAALKSEPQNKIKP